MTKVGCVNHDCDKCQAAPVNESMIEPENQPNQYNVEFGMSGTKMFFKIGNQSFTLDYEPDNQDEFDFMKKMICHALAVENQCLRGVIVK